MRPRRPQHRAPLLLLVLLVATAALTVSAESSSAHELTAKDKENAAAAPVTFEVTDATLSAATTGCGICQQTGYCDHAFKGSPGQFCLTLATGLPCCCPRDAQCAANVYSCRCRRSGYYPPAPPARPTSPDGAKSVSLFSLFAMLLCVGCCVCACCKRQRDERRDPAAYQPVYATAAAAAPPQYGATDQTTSNKYTYAYPSAPPPPDAYNAYNAPYATPVTTDAGYMNPYAAGAVGAAAGLAGGMLIGSALGDHGGNNTQPSGATTTYFDGDSGFANATTSYEFAGDGGDYGGGDDGGDFDGDS